MKFPSPRELLTEIRGFCRFLVAHISDDRCQESAASLTWVTLFALVPMLTVLYTILSLVPAFATVAPRFEDFLFQHFVPATGSEIQSYLHGFTAQARELTRVGSAMLFVSAWLMLRNIEETFNRIWRVPRQRHGMVRVALHWAILSLGPLLAALALLISTYLYSLALIDVPQQAMSLLIFMLPTLLTFITVTLAFVAVPNCRVSLLHAAIGGLLTTLSFNLFKQLFGWVVAHSSYSLVYGAFAAMPLFLLWLYLFWLMLLVGAEFVHALGSYRGAPRAIAVAGAATDQ